jgi:endonuclease/exonuclease/phosphatase (EEP) superfamily protein YafD
MIKSAFWCGISSNSSAPSGLRFAEFGKDAHLVLLQEAQTTPELVRFATTNYLAADQVPAFVLPQHPSGVMTLSSAHPVHCCPLREREPILRLAKSALVTVYPLPDMRNLMVVNVHAVNFSLGVDVYSKQLLPIGDQIAPQRAGYHGR